MNAALAMIVSGSVVVVSGLHVWAGLRTQNDAMAGEKAAADGQWVFAARVEDIAEGRARIVGVAEGNTVAIFRSEGKLFALENRCAHQGGPLGEGCIVDGLVTCPWHGYQYRPQDGCSPPPFTEKVATYRLKLDGDRILVDPQPNVAGTPTEPVVLSQTTEVQA